MKITETDRISSPTRERDGTTILDIQNYAPFLLNAVSSAWQRKTSAIYRRDFDLGILEWRILAMLNIEPQITANRICKVVGLDKGAVSRSLRLLDDRGLVYNEATAKDPRRRKWSLTQEGSDMHSQILSIALGCEAELIEGIAPENLEVFIRVMRRMLANIRD